MKPMIDLKKQYLEIRDEVLHIVNDVLESSQYVLGKRVSELEEGVKKYHGVKEAIGVASGTDALHLSLLALGIGKGDEVIVGLDPVMGIDRNAHAHSEPSFILEAPELVVTDGLPESFRLGKPPFHRRLRQKQDELFPSVAGQHVALSATLLKEVCKFLEYAVAGLMPVNVVDLFEMVDIEH